MGCAYTMQAAAQREKERLAEASNPDKVALSVLSSHNSSLPYLEGSTVRGTIVELNRRTVKIDAGLSQRIRFFRQALPWLSCRHHAGGDPCHSWGSCFSRGCWSPQQSQPARCHAVGLTWARAGFTAWCTMPIVVACLFRCLHCFSGQSFWWTMWCSQQQSWNELALRTSASVMSSTSRWRRCRPPLASQHCC